MFSEFKAFIDKGNAMDLAVGTPNSAVALAMLPLLGLVTGGLDFTQRFIPLAGQTDKVLEEAKKHGAVLAYGSFITVVLNFLIVAFAIFLIVKQINRMRGTKA